MKKYINIKTILPLGLMILCMAVIFGFSAQKSSENNSVSLMVTEKIISRVFRNYDIQSVQVQEYVLYSMHIIIRKLAHFSLYYILGAVIYYTVFSVGKGIKTCFKFSLAIPFIYAVSDEFHQIFTDGRTARILDILIDSAGALCGSLTIFLIIAAVKYIKSEFKKN